MSPRQIGSGGRPGPWQSILGTDRLARLAEIFRVSGGLGDPGALRTDAGVYLHYDVGRLFEEEAAESGPTLWGQAQINDVAPNGTGFGRPLPLVPASGDIVVDLPTTILAAAVTVNFPVFSSSSYVSARLSTLPSTVPPVGDLRDDPNVANWDLAIWSEPGTDVSEARTPYRRDNNWWTLGHEQFARWPLTVLPGDMLVFGVYNGTAAARNFTCRILCLQDG